MAWGMGFGARAGEDFWAGMRYKAPTPEREALSGPFTNSIPDTAMHHIAKEFISSRDKFAKHLGIELEDVAPGYARARMPITDEHTNGLGIVHGGATFALADLAFAAASNSHGQVSVAINASISYVAAGQGAWLVAEARETSLTPRLATYKVSILDEKGETVALFDGMVYRKKTAITDVMGQ